VRLGASVISSVTFPDTAYVLAGMDDFIASTAVPDLFPVWRWLSNPKRRAVDLDLLAGIHERGATPVIFLHSTGGASDWETYGYEAILRGDHDDILTIFGSELAAYGQRVIVRWDQEMNVTGMGAPWQGRSPALYRAAFAYVSSHVRRIAPRAAFHWCPMSVGKKLPTLRDWWPGDAAVQFAGFDRYGTGRLRPLPVVWASTVRAIRAFTERPILVGEFGSNVECRQRAKWLASLADVGGVWGAIYFDLNLGVAGAPGGTMDVSKHHWLMDPPMRKVFAEIAA
jgi:hypothetical protein